MIHAGTPAIFWGDAITHAAYIKNRLPRIQGETKTPTELMQGNIPHTSLLKPFGCQAYIYIPEIRQTKFGPRGRQGIYLGVHVGTKAYKIALLDDLSLQVSKHVRFNETIFPYKTNERIVEVDNINRRYLVNDDRPDQMDLEVELADANTFPVYH